MKGGIGVVGGGQLALMLGQAARRRGIPCHVLQAREAEPASAVATSSVLGTAGDARAMRELADRCRAVTFEHEWLDLAALSDLEQQGCRFVPSPAALDRLISKRHQRELLEAMAIPCPRWLPLSRLQPDPTGEQPGAEPLASPDPGNQQAGTATATVTPPRRAVARVRLPDGWSFPVMAKASRGGYDGRGTRLVPDAAALQRLMEEVPPDDWLLEEFIPFERELALVACRDRFGTVAVYPLVETHQHGHVCDWVLAPAEASPALQAHARNVAASLLTDLDYVGVLAIEFFWGRRGLLVNELAPRTHNSGHYSIEACRSSQFDQQLRIVNGETLLDTDLTVPGALMVNLLGLDLSEAEMETRRAQLRRLPGTELHWYGKPSGAMGRKLGHITLPLKELDAGSRRREAMEHLGQIRAIWPLPGLASA
ncbi:5-(carboxyamino)imidazole ribonucleotide synthase [Synechococcus sp. RSCCF101]|nr:5-(carboxyamino)imidazole ribonucleotide synthase [Synechococcus sp. RSCCF101]